MSPAGFQSHVLVPLRGLGAQAKALREAPDVGRAQRWLLVLLARPRAFRRCLPERSKVVRESAEEAGKGRKSRFAWKNREKSINNQ